MVWYSHLFQNFPQFIVIHVVKGFGIVNKAEIDVLPIFVLLGFPGDSDSKETACNVGDQGLIPGLGRSVGGGHGNPL